MASTTKNSSFTGRCLCGAVEIVFSPEEGQEAKCAFCHCHSCQRWYMNPVRAACGRSGHLARRRFARAERQLTALRSRCGNLGARSPPSRRWRRAQVSVDVMLHEAAPGQGFKLTGELIEDVRTLPTHKTVRLRCSSCKSPVGCKWQMNDAPSDKWGW